MNTVDLSVIVPCYNGERYLAEALRSVLGQRGVSLEILVIDDGSTDNSAAIAGHFGPPVQVIRTVHGGVAAARALGVSLARGGILAFCDADDLWAEDRMPAQLEALQQVPEGVICGLTRQFCSDDWVTPAPLPPGIHRSRHCGATLFPRAVLDRLGPLPTDLIDLQIALFAALDDQGIPVHQHDRVVLHRRLHASNTSRQPDLRRRGYARAVKARLEQRRRQGAEPGA